MNPRPKKKKKNKDQISFSAFPFGKAPIFFFYSPIGPLQAEYKRSRIVWTSAHSSACAIERPDITLDIRGTSVSPDQYDLRQTRAVQLRRRVRRGACPTAHRQRRNENRIFFELFPFSRWWDR